MKSAALSFVVFAGLPAWCGTIAFNYPAEDDLLYENRFQVTAATGPLNSTIVSVTTTEPSSGYTVGFPYFIPPAPLQLPAGANVTGAQLTIYGRLNFQSFGPLDAVTPVQPICESGSCPFIASVLPSPSALLKPQFGRASLVLQTTSGDLSFPGDFMSNFFVLSGEIDYTDTVRSAVANNAPVPGIPVLLNYGWDLPPVVTPGFNSITTRTYDFAEGGFGAATLTVQYEVVPEPNTFWLLLAPCFFAMTLTKRDRPADIESCQSALE